MKGSAAQAGFYYQNNIAALKILDSLVFNSDISHIELENYEKGNHIDDIIIYHKNKIEFYQIKWSEDETESYTLYNLLTPQKAQGKSIFKQLAEGYNSINVINKEISIILYTTKRIGVQKRPSESINHSLKELLEDIIIPLQKESIVQQLANYEKYKTTLQIIQEESGLLDMDFNNFLKSLIFSFNQEKLQQVQSIVKIKLERLGLENKLFEKLLDCVVKWSITGEKITKEIVLKELGILNRFEDKLSHYFKVSEKFYVPNINLSSQINTALEKLDGGYIFIEGAPGVGKSTALTKFKQENPDIVFSYYCFIPDQSTNFGELRHKAQYFLKSMCIAIEGNFPDVDLPNRYSENYEEKLNLYIDKLGTSSKKIVFIIDGLDHVHRNLAFGQESLLNQIKGKLPSNIFIILSSQYKGALSTSVQNEINNNPLRYIKVPVFGQKEISKYLSLKGIELTEDLIQRVEIVSRGIPLYLHYITEILINKESKDYSSIVNDLPQLVDGEINTYHEYLYNQIIDNEYSRWVLAVLAYRKEPASIEKIEKILNIANIDINRIYIKQIIDRLNHLLKINDARGFTIFHNSFREFILVKTLDLRNLFNTALSSYYEQNINEDEAYRNYFKHLRQIGDRKKIISITTLTWIKQAWKDYRQLEEIEDNLSIAISSCIEEEDLANFIRILYLKAQVLHIKFNFENSEINFPCLYLEAGLTQNSLRSIWDGDFIRISKVEFAQYINNFYKLTGTLPSANIIEQGFNKQLIGGDVNSIIEIEQAKSLTTDNIKSIFDEIDIIEWTISTDRSNKYLKSKHTKEKNSLINKNIKLKIIDHLFIHNKFEVINSFVKEHSSSLLDLVVYAKCALIKLLLPVDKRTAIKLLKDIDTKSDKYQEILIYSLNILSNEELKSSFHHVFLPTIEISDELISKEGLDYNLKETVVDLYDNLKCAWLFDIQSIYQIKDQLSILSEGTSKGVLNSIFYLSKMWYEDREKEIAEKDKITTLKYCINELYYPREQDLLFTNHSLFSGGYNDEYFISKDIHRIFSNIFDFTSKYLSENGLQEIISYWLAIEKEKYAFDNHKIAIAFAQAISEYNPSLKQQILRLVEYAEKIVRYEKETAPLLHNLSEISIAYGKHGFTEQFERIYNELFEISFGLHNRKDYQAKYITDSLDELQSIAPDRILNELVEAYNTQKQLSHVGRGRMMHICMSYLIAFTIKHYPKLAFEIIEKEEQRSISREEALSIILPSVIKESNAKELILYLSIVKTINTPESRIDSYFIPLLEKLLERSLQLKSEKLTSQILDTIKYHVSVELNDINLYNTFSSVISKYYLNPMDFGMPKYKEDKEIRKNIKRKEKFSINIEPVLANEAIEMIERDYNHFKKVVETGFDKCSKNRILSTSRNEYYRSKSIVEKFFNEKTVSTIIEKRSDFFSIIRYYLEFTFELSNLYSQKIIETADFETLFITQFVNKIDFLLQTAEFSKFIDNEVDLENWINQYLTFINEHKFYIYSEFLSESEIQKIVENISLIYIDEVIDFIEKYTNDKPKITSLLKISNRLFSLNKNKAISILNNLVENNFYNVYFNDLNENDIGFDLYDMLIKYDESYGRKALMTSFYNRNGRYSYEIISKVHELLKYKQYYEDERTIIETLYNSNLQYNKELTKGLPERKNEFNFIGSHEENLKLEDIIIKYLVSLFDYPVVYVKQLSLQSLFDLLEAENYLKNLFYWGVTKGTDNQKEYSLILILAIALKNPQIVYPFKDDLLELSKHKHFSILELIKSIFEILFLKNENLLSLEEIIILKKLNTPSFTDTESQFSDSKEGEHFIYSEYQADILTQLYHNDLDTTSPIHKVLYSELSKKGFGVNEYTLEDESDIHKSYNINVNFDDIEITTSHYDETKKILNTVFYDKIKRGYFDYSFIDKHGSMFRLFDPSRLLYKKQKKPSYINWVSEIVSEDFMAYEDIDSLIENFIEREQNYITLFENGSQRNKERHGQENFSVYFMIYSFLVKRGHDLSSLNNISPLFEVKNFYDYEMPSGLIDPYSFPSKSIVPLIELSVNNFRGQDDGIKAVVFPEILKEMGIENGDVLNMLLGNEENIKCLYWQSEYIFDRRRYKPNSNGYTLKIRKDILRKFLKSNDLQLCYDLSFSRTCDSKSTPEKYMNWKDFHKTIIIDI